MSWFDDLIDLGSSAFKWFTGNSLGAQVARTAVTGYTLRQVNNSINKDQKTDQQKEQDRGVRLQVDPNPDQKIPVVYGRAALGGIVTDATIANSNQTMYYCLTLCEVTGNLNLGAGAASQITIKEIYWNNQKLVFYSSGANAGYVVEKAIDDAGNENTDIAGQMQIFLYNDGSESPTLPYGYTNATTYDAWDIMPNWGTATQEMSNLVFAIVRVDYSKEKNITSLGDLTFVLENTMNQAGDCLYDYMTNTRYGAGIDPAEIYAS